MSQPTRTPGPGGTAALATVVVVAAVLVAYKVLVAVRVGPGWDTFAFLSNAAEFAGQGFGYTELHRPPFMSWLVAVAFQLGAPLQQSVIQWVDGALTLSGVLAFYFLLRRRFPPPFSATGALALLAVTPLWAYLGVGYTDTASVALSAWMLLALIKATEENPWWYLVAGPLYIAAVMTRFTALLIAFPALVWLLMRWQPFRQWRHVAAAAGLGVATYLPAARLYSSRFGDVLFPFVVALGFAQEVAAPVGEQAAAAQAGFYLRSLPQLLGPAPVVLATVFVLLIAGVGLVRGLGRFAEEHRPRAARLTVAIVAVAVAVGAQLVAGMVLRQVTICIAVLAVWKSLAPYEGETGHRKVVPSAALDAVMLAWLLAYFDFHGHQTIQVPRYFITMAPGIIYFIVRGWTVVADQLDATAATFRGASRADRRSAPYLLAQGALAALVGLALASTVATTPTAQDRYVAAARDSSAWIERHEPDVDDTVIYSDLWPLSAWYLRTSVHPMPSFEETAAFGHELEKARADYFVTIRGRRFAGLDEAYTGEVVAVLERTSSTERDRPRVAYLGKSWDNYLESVTDYGFYLVSTAGRYGWEGSAFLDEYTAEELAGFDAVAVYGPRWRNRADGESALAAYVESGGSLVIDASRNLDGLAYQIGDTIMFDTVVRRDRLPADAGLRLDPGFASRHGLDGVTAAPFVDETGRQWVGASYEARPGAPELETIAWLDNKPAIQVQRLGQGRVYWIGYNLVWHAFYTESGDEARLISAVFDEAVARSTGPADGATP